MDINVASMVKMAKYAIPEMAKNEGQWRGSIVNIASVAGLRGGNPHLLYPTSKGAIVVGHELHMLSYQIRCFQRTDTMAEYDPCYGGPSCASRHSR